jgi:hypothetical protein
MVNVEALLSPTGGYNYDETINSGITGLLLGFGLDRGLYHSFLAKPALRFELRKGNLKGVKDEVYKQRTGLARAQSRLTSSSLVGPPTAAQGRFGFGANADDIGPPTPERELRQRRLRAVAEGRETRRKAAVDTRRAKSKNIKNNLRSVKSLIRGGVYAQLMSFGVELATEAFTPGISKITRKREEEFMQQGQQDSPALYTMRQRAVMAIHNSMMTTRNVIGNEAQFMHR